MCLACCGTGEHRVCEEQLVDVLTDVAFELLSLHARERARNVASVLMLEHVSPDAPEWEPLIVTMLGRARQPHLGGVDVTDEDLREVARRVAAYVRGEDLFPRPVKPGEATTTRAAEHGAPPPTVAECESEPSSPLSTASVAEEGASDGR